MKVQLFGNLRGAPGTQRTINVMRKLVDEGRVDPTIIFLAQQLARKYDRKDYRGQANAIHDYVRDHIHYVKDPRATEMVRSPFWTLYYKAGDCDDQSVLVAALAEAIGFRTRFKAIKVDPNFPAEFSHVYSQIQIPTTGEWVTSDTIVPGKNLGWEAEQMFGERTWEGLGGMSGMGRFGSLGAETSFWGSIGNALKDTLSSGIKDVATGYIDKFKSDQGLAPTQQAPVAAPVVSGGGLPGWVLPVGVAGAVATLLVLVKRKR